MEVIQFTNPATALVYETDFEVDVTVHVNCTCNGGKGYSGKLSDLPPGAAQELLEQKSNLVRLKPVPKKKQTSTSE